MDDIARTIEALAEDEVKEEPLFLMGKAKQGIVSWKAHLLWSVKRKVNQG